MNFEIKKNGVETYKRNVRKPLIIEIYSHFPLLLTHCYGPSNCTGIRRCDVHNV